MLTADPLVVRGARCDVVANRGAVARQVRDRLRAPGGARRRRFLLVDAAEAEDGGRVQLVWGEAPGY